MSEVRREASRYFKRRLPRLLARVEAIFDREHYVRQDLDLSGWNHDLVLHYLRYGWAEGRDPHPLFSNEFYLDRYPDIEASGVPPLLHYCAHGSAEGRDPHPLFNETYYRAAVSDDLGERTGLGHFIVEGWRSFDPNPDFSTAYYLSAHEDVAAVGMNPLVHFLQAGHKEGRRPRADLTAGDFVARYYPSMIDAKPNYGGIASSIDAKSSVSGARCDIPPASVAKKASDKAVKIEIGEKGFVGEIVYDGDFLEGWLGRDSDDAPVHLTATVDGVRFFDSWADRRTGGRGDQGFRLMLPDREQSGALRVLSLSLDRGAHVVDLTVRGDDFFGGAVETVDIGSGVTTISGWCADGVRPERIVSMAAYLNGAVIGEAAANIARPDLRDKGLALPFGGFAIEIPTLPADQLKKVGVGPVDTTVRLPWIGATVTEQAAQGEPRLATEADKVTGSVDKVTSEEVSGWARIDADAVVFVELLIDDHPVAISAARSFRPDLAKAFGDHGCYAYRFELTLPMVGAKRGKVSVRPLVGRNAINSRDHRLPQSDLAQTRIVGGEIAPAPVEKPAPVEQEASVAVIVLNRNGGHLMHRMFASFDHFNTYGRLSFIVVDHGSTDDSDEVINRWSTQFNIDFIRRGDNYSFSASNNYAAARTDADIVLFYNNDARLGEDSIGDLVAYLRDETVGAVGCMLRDDTPSFGPTDALHKDHPVQHRGVHLSIAQEQFGLHAFEVRASDLLSGNDAVSVPVVTGAVVALRRSVFEELRGFEEAYFYGYEDVDLSLKVRAAGYEVVVAEDVQMYHMRGYSRQRMKTGEGGTALRNRLLLDNRFGFSVSRHIKSEVFSRPAFWSGKRPIIAFVVTELSESTLAGDVFTAKELAEALTAQFPCDCIFVPQTEDGLEDLSAADVVIGMRDDFNPATVKRYAPHAMFVLWARNWFARLPDYGHIDLFDQIWASSPRSAEFLSSILDRPVDIVPIATNKARFAEGEFDRKLSSDYCFTGSYWGVNRQIIQMLDPAALPYEFAIYGQGWEGVPHLAPYTRGSLRYERMAAVYANTRVVIDDANHTTKAFGSVNSRVFDALAAGALVITNGEAGAADTFGGRLPSFDSPQKLEALLRRYLGDEDARRSLVGELQAFVLSEHTYEKRAQSVWKVLNDRASDIRVSIKIGAPRRNVRDEWGDYHFAVGLQSSLRKRGYLVRIDTIEEWNTPRAAADDVVIVLRGLTQYVPKAHQINLMWQISHPDKTSVAELRAFDHVFVASQKHSGTLESVLDGKVSTLLQCTDPARFNTAKEPDPDLPSILFVGNSREQRRPIVADAVQAGLDVSVYGTRWLGFIPDSNIKGAHIPNEIVPDYYRSCELLLNDHWDTMREYGYISNRLFDAVACGARVVSDDVPGLNAVFGDLVHVYEDQTDLRRLAALGPMTDDERTMRDDAAKVFQSDHSFDARAANIADRIERLVALRMKETGTA